MFSQQIWSLSLQLDWRSTSRWDTLLSVSLAMGLQMCKITPGFYVDARHPNSGPQTCTGRTVLPEPSSQPFKAVFILLHHCRCSLINFFSTHNIPDRLRDLELKYPKFPFLRFVLFYIYVCACLHVGMCTCEMGVWGSRKESELLELELQVSVSQWVLRSEFWSSGLSNRNP